ncbi:hypothetical protein [Paremcibacter congregatus]|uniref:hypothetical protein n=1 Tax=Paremcibacter congregatus TaxID=2043170 RepID=UPI0030EF6871|tara:strand:- start:659 stop:871 length:213 start_codon:yes stop_codon:yes gene_type:complete
MITGIIIGLIGLGLTAIGFYFQFCPNGVVTGRDFESRHPASLTVRRVFCLPEIRPALKKSFTRPAGRNLR